MCTVTINNLIKILTITANVYTSHGFKNKTRTHPNSKMADASLNKMATAVTVDIIFLSLQTVKEDAIIKLKWSYCFTMISNVIVDMVVLSMALRGTKSVQQITVEKIQGGGRRGSAWAAVPAICDASRSSACVSSARRSALACPSEN